VEKYFWQSLPKNAARIIATLFLHRTSLLRMDQKFVARSCPLKKVIALPDLVWPADFYTLEVALPTLKMAAMTSFLKA